MALDKKQKKQLEAAKTKLAKLRQLMAGAREQPDEPNEISRIREQMADVEDQIRKIHDAG